MTSVALPFVSMTFSFCPLFPIPFTFGGLSEDVFVSHLHLLHSIHFCWDTVGMTCKVLQQHHADVCARGT
jgi:hypothetical protein